LSAHEKRRVREGVVNGTEMTVLKVNEAGIENKSCVGTIAMVARDMVTAQTAISLLMTDLSFMGPQEYVLRYIVQGNVLVFQRNQCIHDMDGDWILFIDSDMAWQPGAVKTLIETREKFDLDIVGALCFQRSEPYQPTMYVRVDDEGDVFPGYTYLEEWEEDAAVEVDATGMAFCLIHKRVFDRILSTYVGEPFPSLEERRQHAAQSFFKWNGRLGEDFQFCYEAKATGSRIFVDTSVKVDHIGLTAINENDFLRELAFRDERGQAFRESQLEAIGYRASTPERARERMR
jgi:glycosyltransferase involved in cell wall biosynthesis